MILIFVGLMIFLVGFPMMLCTFVVLILLPIFVKSSPNGGVNRKMDWSGVAIAALGFLTALVGFFNALAGLLKG